jgi:hypothetical protein
MESAMKSDISLMANRKPDRGHLAFLMRPGRPGIALVFLILCLLYSNCLAKETPSAGKDHAELWLLSTRCAPLCGDLEVGKEQIHYWRFAADCRWEPEAAGDFFRPSADHRPTVFVIHGNRESADEAIEFAWPVYQYLKERSECRPFRLVIWSWPSDRVARRNRPDVQIKASYCDPQSYYLADHLRRLDSAAPVYLTGYSFGSRIIAGGLHLLGGGCLAGRQLPPEAGQVDNLFHPSIKLITGQVDNLSYTVDKPTTGHGGNLSYKAAHPSIHALLVAGAMPSYWLAPDQRNGLALSQVEAAWITCNGCDPVLRWYPRLYGRGGPEALGYVGPTCGGDWEKMEVVDVTCAVGKEHHWEGYLYCSGVLPKLQAWMFP